MTTSINDCTRSIVGNAIRHQEERSLNSTTGFVHWVLSLYYKIGGKGHINLHDGATYRSMKKELIDGFHKNKDAFNGDVDQYVGRLRDALNSLKVKKSESFLDAIEYALKNPDRRPDVNVKAVRDPNDGTVRIVVGEVKKDTQELDERGKLLDKSLPKVLLQFIDDSAEELERLGVHPTKLKEHVAKNRNGREIPPFTLKREEFKDTQDFIEAKLCCRKITLRANLDREPLQKPVK